MILTRSPYYLTIPWESPSSMTIPDKYIIELYIWEGLKASVPLTATYEIENKNPLERTGSVDVDISSYINDFLTVNLEVDTETNVIDSKSAIWVKSQVIYYISDVAQTPEFESTDLAIKGYGYGIEGKNTTIPTNNALTSALSVNVSAKTYFNVPIKVSESEDTDVSVLSYPDNDIDYIDTISATTDSDELIKNVFIDCSELITDTSIQVSVNDVVVKELILKNEYRYTPIDIWFINKFGELDTLVFFKEKIDNLSVSSEDYETNIGQPIDGVHQFKKFNTNGQTDFKINSGFVKESNNEVFKQLFLSNDIWHYNGTSFIPLNLKSSSLEYKTRQKDRLINYQINFEYAFNEINTI